MSNERTRELIEAVNEAVDPVALVNLINFFPEKKVLSGTTLRVPCPVHRDEEYLTLFINTRKKTYRCSVESCSAHEPGDMVGLYALAREVSRAAAAREIATRLRLPVDLPSFARIASECFDQAEEHFVKRELDHAEAMIRQTLTIDDDHVEALQLLGRIQLERRQLAEAATTFLKVARLVAARGDIEEAERVLRRAIGHHCEPSRMYEALAQLLLEAGRRDEARHALEEQLVLARGSSDPELEIGLLEEISELAPDDETVREELARALERQGNDERAIDLFLRLGERELDQGRPQRALVYLEEALRLNPSFVLALERKVDVHLARRETYPAAEVLRRLSELARDRHDAEQAREYLTRVVDLLPNDPKSYDALATFHEWAADTARAFEARLRAARLVRSRGQLPEARRRLEELCRHLPPRVEAVEELAELLLQQGEVEGSIARFEEAARQYVASGRRDEALRLMRQIVLYDEANLERRRTVLARLEEFGFERPAEEERRELVRRAFLARRYDLCLALVDEGLRRAPRQVELLSYRREVLGKLSRDEEFVGTTLELAEEFVVGGRAERAENLLRESLGMVRHVALFDRLLMLLLQAGRGPEAAEALLEAAPWLGEEASRARGVEFARVLLQAVPGAEAVRMLLAGWLLDSRQESEAITLFRGLAEQARRAGEFVRAEQCLRFVLKAAPEDRQARADLARLAAERGETATARGELLGLLADRGAWDAATVEALRRSVLRIGAADEELLRAFLVRLDQSSGGGAAVADARAETALALARLVEVRDAREAASLAGQALATRPSDVDTLLYLQRQLARTGDAEGARALTARGLEVAKAGGLPEALVAVLAQGLELFPLDEEVVAEALEVLPRESYAERLMGACGRIAAQAQEREDRTTEKTWIDRKIELAGGAASPADLERLATLARETSNRQEQLDALLRLIQARREREGPGPALDQAMSVIKAFPLDARPRELAVELLRELGRVDHLVDEIVTLGDLAVSRRSWSRAEMHFREAMELAPGRLDIFERFAQSYEERGERERAARLQAELAQKFLAASREEEALRAALRASELDPAATAHLPLVLELQDRAGNAEGAAATALRLAEAAVARRDAAELGAMALRAAGLAPRSPAMRRRLAELHGELGLLDKASRHYAAAGQLHFEEEQFDEAERCCREALSLNGDLVSARELLVKLQARSGDAAGRLESLRSLAISHSSEGNIEESVAAYRRLLEAAPDDRQALVDLSECLLLLGREGEAAKVLRRLCFALDVRADADLLLMHGRRLIELDPRDIELRERLAEAYAASGKLMPEVDQRAAIFMETVGKKALRALAQSQLERLRAIAPDSFEARLCEARWEGGERHAADLYERMISELAAGGDARALARLAAILAESEAANHRLRSAAVAALLKVAGLTDEALTLMRALQRDLAAASATEEQVALLDAAVEASGGHPKYLSERGDLRLAGEKREAAVADYVAAAQHHARHEKAGDALRMLQKAARLAPDASEVHRQLAEAAEKVGDASAACAAYARQLELLERDKAPEEAMLLPLLRLTELLPTDDRYHERLLKVYRELGKNRQAAEMLVERAGRLEKANRAKDAERDYQAALKLEPGYSPGRKAYAEFLAKAGRREEARTEYLALAEQFDARGKVGLAIQAVNLARELDPNDPVPYERIGEIYARQNNKERALNAFFAASNRHLDRRQPVRAAEMLVRSMELSPEDARAPKQLFTIFFALPECEETTALGMKLARGFLRGGEVKQAGAILERLRAAPGRTWEFQVAIAQLYREFDQRHQAHDIYLETAAQLAIEGRHEDALAILRLAEGLNFSAIDIERTRIEILEQAGAGVEELLVGWRRLADLIRDSPEASPEQELAYRERILSAAPDDAANRERIAEVHVACGDTGLAAEQYVALAERALPEDPEAAIRRLRQALGADGSHAGALERLAGLHAERGEVETACEEWARLARLHHEAGRLGEEEAVLMRVLRENPHHIEALRAMMEIVRRRQDANAFWNYGLKLAMMFESMGRGDEARRLYEEAVMMDGGNIEAWQRLAVIHEATGDRDATVRIQKNLARVHEERGEVERALEAYERALEASPEDLNLAIEAADLAAGHGLNQVAAHLLESSLTVAGKRVDVEPALLVDLCRKLLQLAPARHETRRMLAHLLEDCGDVVEAAAEWNNLATFYSSEGRVSDALHALKRLRTLSPEDADRITLRIASLEAAGGREEEAGRLFASLVERHRAAGEKEQALELARRMANDLPFDPRGDELAAELCAELGRTEGRVRHLCSMATRLAEMGDLRAAEGRIAEARAAAPESLEPVRAHGRLLLQAGAMPEAHAAFADLLARAEKAEDEFMVVEALRGLKTAAPEDLQTRVRLLEKYEREGNIEELARERSEMVEIFFMIGDIDSAADIAGLLLRDPITTPDVIFRIAKRFEVLAAGDIALRLYLDMARGHLEKKEYGIVEEALDAARELKADDLEVLDLTLALQEAIGDVAGSFHTRERLAAASVDAGQLSDAELHLQKVIAARPEDPDARLQLARVFGLRQNSRRQAEELRIAADLFDRQGYVERAYETLQQFLALQPDDPLALRKVADIAPGFLDVEEFRDDFYRLAEVYILRGQKDEFELLAQEADAIMPGDPHFAELRDAVAKGRGLHQRTASAEATRSTPAPASRGAAGDGEEEDRLGEFFAALDAPAPAAAEPAGARGGGASDGDGPPSPDLDSIWGAGELSSVDAEREVDMAAPGEMAPGEVDEELDFEIDPGLIRSQIRGGDAGKVAELLHLAIRQRPSDLELHLLLAEAHLALGERAMGVQELSTASSLLDDPRDPRRLTIARAIHELEPDSLRALAQYVDLLFEFEKTDEALARSLDLAERYRRRGMNENSEELVRRILAHDAQHVGALQLLVTLHRDVTPPHDFALDLVLLATALGIEGQTEEAHAALDQARTLGAYAVEPMTAVVRARRALGRDQRLADELTVLARLYVDEGNPMLALGCLEEADTISTSGSLEREEVRRRLQQVTPRGATRLGSGLPIPGERHDTQVHRSEAIENFLAVLRVDPKNADVHMQIASLYAQSGEHEGERLHVERAIAILQEQGAWQELINRLPALITQFPESEVLGEALKKARMQVRMLQLIEGDETQTVASQGDSAAPAAPVRRSADVPRA